MADNANPVVPTPELASSMQAPSYEQNPLQYGYGGGIILGGFGAAFDSAIAGNYDTRYPLPPYWSPLRDLELRRYSRSSIILGGLLDSRITQIQNLEWSIEATDKALEPYIPQYMDMLEHCQFGDGFRAFLGKWLFDYHTQDNGAFIEWQGLPNWQEQRFFTGPDGQRYLAAQPLGGLTGLETPQLAAARAKEAVLSFSHIDAQAAWRTGNKLFPVVYRNQRYGYYVVMPKSRVSARAQLVQPGELTLDLGFCAVSRAFQAMEIIQATSDYMYEKVTGGSPTIGIMSGMALEAVRQAVKDNALEMDNKGLVRWKGAMLLQANAMAGITPDIKLVDIKSIPDGFDRENEFTLNLYLTALAFGTDLRDIGWNKSITGSTRADAEVQDAKTSGRGRQDAISTITDELNRRLLPKGLSFKFSLKDDLEEERKATIGKLRAEMRAMRITSGELSVDEARELAARVDDLPPEFLASQTVVNSNDNLPDSPIESPVDSAPELLAQDLQADGLKTVGTYERALLALINRYRKGQLDKASFKRDMRAVIDKQFRLAWIAGAKAVEASPFDEQGLAELDALATEEMQYVQQFADAVQELIGQKAITLDSIRNRLGMWANQFLRIKNRAMLFLGGDKRLKWVYGDTIKHCDSCLSLNGHVATASDWYKANIQPQDRQLACSGYNCKCDLIPTDEPLTRGPIPKVGVKHHHED